MAFQPCSHDFKPEPMDGSGAQVYDSDGSSFVLTSQYIPCTATARSQPAVKKEPISDDGTIVPGGVPRRRLVGSQSTRGSRAPSTQVLAAVKMEPQYAPL
jgi:hypothetical protein